MPDYVLAILWATLAALASAVTIVVSVSGREIRSTIRSYGRLARARMDHERAQLASWASDQAVASVEEEAKRDDTLKGERKAHRAQQEAEELLRIHGSVPSTVPPSVIQASVQRMRASSAAPSAISLAPGTALSIPVVVTSSSAPPDADDPATARQTIPRAPPMPTGYHSPAPPRKKP